jgi:hypothetical protein
VLRARPRIAPDGRQRAPTVLTMDLQTAPSPRETIDALLIWLGRVQAAAETLRSMTDHTAGTASPSVSELLRTLDRDLVLAARDVAGITASLARYGGRRARAGG